MSLDRLSNMLSAIKNASMVGKPYIEVPHSIECERVASVFKNEGYLAEVKSFKPKGKSYKMLRLDLAYDKMGTPLINSVKRVSKPGRRIYKGSGSLGAVIGGYGFSVVTTSRGVMTGSDARKKKLGGELICEVY